MKCPECNGSGLAVPSEVILCVKCNGSGKIHTENIEEQKKQEDPIE